MFSFRPHTKRVRERLRELGVQEVRGFGLFQPITVVETKLCDGVKPSVLVWQVNVLDFLFLKAISSFCFQTLSKKFRHFPDDVKIFVVQPR